MKQCELWNVLQNEDEHRLLDSADIKYDALIIHIWALNNFVALFSNTVGVADWAAQRPVFGRRAHCAGDVTSYARKQKINEIPAVSSEMSFDSRSLRRPTNMPIHVVFLETRSIGLHFAADNISLSSLKFL